MKCPPALVTETQRLQALAEYGLGSDRALPSLDAVVQIAARMFDMPVSAVNMIGNDHVFFAASTGLDGEVDMRRDVSFCAHAITQDDVLVVPDAQLDERFFDNPLVTGSAQLRFYAGVPLLSPEGHALGALCIIDARPREFSQADRLRLRELARMASDRLELRRMELSVEQRTRPTFEEYARNSATAVVWFDEQGTLIAWNEAAVALFGYDPADGPGRDIRTLIAAQDREIVTSLIAQGVAQGSVDGLHMPDEMTGLRRDGNEFLMGLSLFCWRENGVLAFSAHLQDLTAQRREEDEQHRRANLDVLTGLANRARFYRQVEDTLVRNTPAAVLMIDLDGFKDINDTLGHAVGDGILREIADRLTSLAGARDTVARVGGDEFAILLHGLDTEAPAAALAQAVITSVAQPILIDGHEVHVVASCGIAIAPLHAQEALELISSADLALFRAKTLGRAQWFVFVTALRMEAVARRAYGMELHRAVAEGEFLLFYQPQIRLTDGALTGAEALIRWQHPQRGLLSPAAFLPALEGGPLAATVGTWVLDEACAQAAQWRRAGAQDFRISVNLFGAQFRVGSLVDDVLMALHRHGLPPEALELEITENIVLDHDDVVLDTLNRLRALGVGIAFDDFGTGYASLSLLKRYPLSWIKIDRSFVKGMLESRQDASLVNAILDMARSFELDTIAEGVETAAQHAALGRAGCSEGQGYLYGRPIPAWQFARVFGIGPSSGAVAA